MPPSKALLPALLLPLLAGMGRQAGAQFSPPAPTYTPTKTMTAADALLPLLLMPLVLIPRVRLAIGGTVQAEGDGGAAIGGVVAAVQSGFRHALLGVEFQSTGTRGDERNGRHDLALLVNARLYAWRGLVAPYLEVAAGGGTTSRRLQGYESSASQLLGRFGGGVELRLGRHVVLDGGVGQVHRWSMEPVPPRLIGEHERALELRAGLGIRI
jgi:hypothetical protein